MATLRKDAIETGPCRYGMMSFFENDTVISRSLKDYGEWAQAEIEFLLDLISFRNTVLDIGAFIGTHTLAFAKRVSDGGKVYAFEPQPVFFEVLKKNVQHNGLTNVSLFDVAVSDRVRRAEIHEIDVRDTCNFGETSLFEAGSTASDAGDRHVINVMTLDQLAIKTCDLIKIDAENMEINILKGARQTLRASRPVVFAECNSLQFGWPAVEFMKEEGYYTYLLNVQAYNPNNFRQNRNNFFGDARETGLILIPTERLSAIQDQLRRHPSLIPISCLDDLALGLLKKPQYKHEVISKGEAARVLGVGFWANETEVQQLRGEAKAFQTEAARMREQVGILEARVANTDLTVTGLRAQVQNLEARVANTDLTVTGLRAQVQTHQRALAEKEEQLAEREQLFNETVQKCDQALQEVSHLRLALSDKEAGIQQLQERIEALTRTLELEQTARNVFESELSEIRTSLAWRVISGYRRAKDRWFPGGTRRRKLYDGVLKCLKKATRKTHSTELDEIVLPRPRFVQNSAVRPVDIIIPVYNQFTFVKQCIDSVFKHRCPSYNQIWVVDDASSDPELIEYLKSLEKIPDLRLIRNSNNLGFGKTANLAMKLSSNDVLLLNSDTIVTKDWLTKIQQAAYFRDDTATVSPLSNNATICSIPNCCEANPVPTGFSVDSFAKLVEDISLRIYPEVPTTVGFCMYIKREALKKVGYFDEEMFREGYGEENDLCMRLAGQGYKHVIDDSTYVYHFGSASFPKEKQATLLSAGVDRVAHLHPTYLGMVQNYLRQNPLQCYYSYLRSILHIQSASKPVVLIVLHAPMESLGGVELQTGDLTRDLGDYFLALMEGVGQKMRVRVFCKGVPFLRLAFSLECQDSDRDQEEIFSFLLRAFNVQLVHFQHRQGRPCSLPRIAKLSGAKTIVSLHDFYLFCESYNLLNYREEFCDYERDCFVCSDCLHRKGLIDKRDPEYQRHRRNGIEKMMRDDVDVIIAPSDFMKCQFSSLFPHVPTDKYRVLENGA